MEFVDYAFQHCRDTGAYIWGVYPVNNVFFSKNRPEISHSDTYILGCLYGIINRHDMMLKDLTDEKEDVRRSLDYFIRDGIVLRFNHIMYETKYYNNVGGIGKLQNRIEAGRLQVIKLLQHYSRYGYQKIRKKGANKGVYEFCFKKVDCQIEKCYCHRQVKFHNDLIINIPTNPGSIVHFPTLKEKDDGKIQLFDEIQPSIFNPLYEMFKLICFEMVEANHRRRFPAHRCAIFGYTNYRVVKNGLYSGLSKFSLRFPAVYQELVRLGKEVICPGYKFNAIHINHNLTCPPHKDDKNVGKSC